MADSESEFPQATGKKGKLPLMLGVVALAIVGAGGAAAFAFDVPGRLMGAEVSAEDAEEKKVAKAKKSKKKKKKGYDDAMAKLDPFVVSLPSASGPGRGARLRFSVAIDGVEPELIQEKKMRLRSDFLSAVYKMGADDVEGADGLERLRNALKPKAAAILGADDVQILITEFVLI